MKKQYFALTALALGLMTTGALAQASRLALQGEPAKDGTPAWSLAPSFPDSTGFTIVEADEFYEEGAPKFLAADTLGVAASP